MSDASFIAPAMSGNIPSIFVRCGKSIINVAQVTALKWLPDSQRLGPSLYVLLAGGGSLHLFQDEADEFWSSMESISLSLSEGRSLRAFIAIAKEREDDRA
jgi:hypothetical protein